MAKSPAFQFYPKDWLTDAKVKAMTFEAKGAYIDLLGLYWLEEGLPASTDKLARLIGMAPAKFRRLWPEIEPCFRVEGDRIHQKRMDEERSKQDAHRAERSETGRKGATKKWAKEVTKPMAQPMAQPSNQNGSASEQPLAKNGSSFPSPFPSPSPSARTERTNERSGPPANPLLGPGDRVKLELECLSLVRQFAGMTGEDTFDVMARASGFEGAKTTKVNPASMTDDRLINTVRDLRADVAAEEKRRGASKSAGL